MWQDRARTRKVEPAKVDAEALAQELHDTIRGEVRFDEGSRAFNVHRLDASGCEKK